MNVSDPRVGSARDNSTAPGVSRIGSGTNSASVTGLLATLIPVGIWTAICVLIFVVLRRKCHRVYAPRSVLKSLEPHERSAPLPTGWFNWYTTFYRVPDAFVLNHSSLDGYLFLRFLRVLAIICVVGILLLWPILIPLHITGGGGNQALDAVTIGNVVNPNRLYAHTALAWVYFAFILYMVSRECIYYINLRQAYLLSDFYANRLSSRTVLYMNVPRQYLDEERLRWMLGKSVKRIWIPQTSDELDRLVKEREQTALRLEKAEFSLIRMANIARARALKKQRGGGEEKPHHPPFELESPEGYPGSDRKTLQFTENPESPSSTSTYAREPTLPDVAGSVASKWISHGSRPRHRPIGNALRSVDTIKWSRLQIKKLNSKIRQHRHQQLFKTNNFMPSVFVEFETHTDAQDAYQTLTHHRPLHMAQRYLGVRPFEILWDSLSMSWWQTIIRRFSIQAFICAMIIFWALPCAAVGTISNIQYLSEKVPFLSWIGNLPASIKGVLSGVIPALALSFLMSIVPGILRFLAKLAGIPTLTMIELFVQNAYFAFQVVQVFLITTLTSAASAAISQLLSDPTLAKSLLSQNLPKASNFYLNYFLLQSLVIGSTHLVQMFNIFKFHVFQRFAKDARKTYMKYHRLEKVHWGGVFPVYTNLGVITITYSLIAPVILGFALLGVAFVHAVWRYNLIYVYDSEIDTRGLVYPRALMQLLLGLYFSEVCLIGLFTLKGAFFPVVLMAALLVITGLVHHSLINALGPLLWSLPKSLTAEKDQPLMPNASAQGLGRDVEDPERFRRRNTDIADDDSDHEAQHEVGASRGVEGLDGAVDTLKGGFKVSMKKRINASLPELNVGLGALASFWRRWLSPDPSAKSNFLLRWLHPEVYTDYTILRRMVPTDLPEPKYPEDIEQDVYYPPSFIAKPPRLWIPRDPAGVSRQEVEHTEKTIPMTDEHVSMDENGRLKIDLESSRLVFDIDRLRY
ncbi:uncharacterized protein A1O9_02095 [Exophiala aquamarina CBS 119918]|uniref:DUF221 domain-containing protein n=1 Tax=Exophiala aquamarina CBS 119918 TaxID=1182545 RepID=A0A072PK91_9EURO|nr:uncharacterized protein A1O9_02095 [Exophiala aquamarina CBS 119918]KEF60534.1 hypothetical protein A1O9_02095 [Exophiala aquamarina CBS 119918]